MESRELLSRFWTCSAWRRWLKVGDKWKKILWLLKQFHGNVRSKTPRCSKLVSSEKQNDALMHRAGLKGWLVDTDLKTDRGFQI